jgi:NADH-quinone oxidoreductase subunit J
VTAENIAFGIIAAVMAFAAIRVVTTTNIFRAALHLVIVLAGVAANYILLASEFTAIVQVLVYIGAVVVLVLFAIMLTRAPIGRTTDLDNDQRGVAAAVALLLLGVLVYVLNDAFEAEKIDFAGPQTSGEVGDSIFQTFVIPFEVVSVLLLAALVGAIVLARRD